MNNLSHWQSAIKQSFPKFESINPERARIELGFALQQFQNSQALQKCDAQSIVNAIVNIARLSITLNPAMRLAYLVPRGNKCVLDISYMGMVAMLKDYGCIKTINAIIVYEDEDFDYNGYEITHKPTYAKTEELHNAREIIGVYTRAVLPSNDVVYEFMPMWEIDKIRKSSTNANSKYSAWVTWKDEMIKKTCIKRHFKMLINIGEKSDKISALLELENENNPLKNDFNKKSQFQTAFINNEDKPQIQIDELITEYVQEEKDITETPPDSKTKKTTTKKKMVDETFEISDADELAIQEQEKKQFEDYQKTANQKEMFD